MTARKAIAILTSVLLMSVLGSQPSQALSEGKVSCSGGGEFEVVPYGDFFRATNGRSCVGTATLPEGISEFDSFDNSAITNMVLPNSLQKIDRQSFLKTLITSIDIPGSVYEVVNKALEGSIIETFNIAAGTSGLSPTAFREAKKLKNINVDPSNPLYTSEDGVLFNKGKTVLLQYPRGKLDVSYTIPETVKVIGPYAFEEQKILRNLKFPKVLNEIGESAFFNASGLKGPVPLGTSLGLDALKGSGLTVINNSKQIKCSKGGAIETKNKTAYLVRPASWWGDREPTQKEVAQWEAKNCNGTVTIPKGIVEIPDAGFYATRLSNLVIPSTVSKIGESAFESSHLTSVSLPEGLTTLSWGLFSQAKKLKTVKLPSTITSIGAGAFAYAESLTEINIPKSVQSIGADAFTSAKKLKKIVIPVGVKSISDSTFNGALSLGEVTIPNTVEVIGNYAFTLTALKYLEIPEGVKEISNRSFNCLSTSPVIVLPASLSKMSNRSFDASIKTCRPAKQVGTPKIYFLGNAPAITGKAVDQITIYISKTATGFNLDPTTKLWHGFKVAYGTPPKSK